MLRNTLFSVLAALLVTSTPAMACVGKVVGVTDGDTIKVLCEGVETKVRLNQIDTPERGQAFGSKAKEGLSNLVFSRTVRLEVVDTDRYGRSVATVWMGEMDVNREMVRLGFAWAYRKYLQDQTLIEVEAEAKSSRRGLWADPNPIAPWEFRKAKRSS
jgi:micrococcal nuclease